MSGSITSAVTVVKMLSQISYDISWSGSNPLGYFSVQVSNTYSQNADGSVKTPGNWTSLTLSAPTSATGIPSNGFIDVDATGAYAIRLIFTPSGGSSGILNATIAAKVA
jgi:hypothetical protein